MNQVFHAIENWIESRDDIRLVLLVGSRARADHPADEYSDLDLVVYCQDPDRYLTDVHWIEDMGTVWVAIPFDRGDGFPEHLIVYEGGYKVDVAFFSIDKLDQLLNGDHYPVLYRRGFQILSDKDNFAENLRALTFAPLPAAKPDEATFNSLVHSFWYEASQMVKWIRRRELWVAIERDSTLKNKLLTLIEWRTRAQKGWNVDTWYGGRFIANWADAEIIATLDQCFPRYNAPSLWSVLLATTDLFSRLAHETADQLDYDYPDQVEINIVRYIRRHADEDSNQ
jgi:aminoglycoside 6-adenylyltransferase